MRRDDLYLADIIEAADSIGEFLANANESAFLGSDLLRSAVLQKLMVIGEAAARLSGNLRHRHPAIPWAEIAVHAYFSVKWPVVWLAATEDVPLLRTQVAEALRAEESGENP